MLLVCTQVQVPVPTTGLTTRTWPTTLIRVAAAVATSLICRKPNGRNGVGDGQQAHSGIPDGSDLAELGASADSIGNKGRNDE